MELNKALALHTRVSPTRDTIPMQHGALVAIDGGILSIQTTNLYDHYLTTYHDMPGAAPMAPVIVPVRDLAALVKAAPNTGIAAHVAALTPICEAADWLAAPQHTVTGAVTMPRTVLDVGASAMSREETRYYLCGMHVGMGGHAVTTDGHRMVVQHLPAVSLPHDIIIPARAIDMLQRLLLPKARDMLTLTIGAPTSRGTWVRFETPSMVYQSALIDGTFPDWRRKIPRPSDHTMTARVGTLTKHAAALVKLYPRKKDAPPAIRLAHDTVTSVTSLGASATLALALDGENTGFKPAGFNARYLAAWPTCSRPTRR